MNITRRCRRPPTAVPELSVGHHCLPAVFTTKDRLFKSKVHLITGLLWSVGLCLNFVLSISPLWGWSPFLGWLSALVLVVFAIDERKSISSALTSKQALLDRILATFLLALPALAIGINLSLLAFGRELQR